MSTFDQGPNEQLTDSTDLRPTGLSHEQRSLVSAFSSGFLHACKYNACAKHYIVSASQFVTRYSFWPPPGPMHLTRGVPHAHACPPVAHFQPPTAYLPAPHHLHVTPHDPAPLLPHTAFGHPQAPYACTWPLPMVNKLQVRNQLSPHCRFLASWCRHFDLDCHCNWDHFLPTPHWYSVGTHFIVTMMVWVGSLIETLDPQIMMMTASTTHCLY